MNFKILKFNWRWVPATAVMMFAVYREHGWWGPVLGVAGGAVLICMGMFHHRNDPRR